MNLSFVVDINNLELSGDTPEDVRGDIYDLLQNFFESNDLKVSLISDTDCVSES